MSKIINTSEDNYKVYNGLLSQKEIEEAENLLSHLLERIPIIEDNLKIQYNDTLDYKYYMGKELSHFIDTEKIPDRERIYFWNEIDTFVSKNHPKNRSEKRNFYEYCYLIYTFGFDIAHSLTWRQWNDILDRKKIRADNRIFFWINQKKSNKRLSRYWRDFVITLNMYIEKKDTSVFTDEELFAIYDSLLNIAEQYNVLYNLYFNKNKVKLTSARHKNPLKYKKMFINESIVLLRKSPNDFNECLEASFIKIFLLNV